MRKITCILLAIILLQPWYVQASTNTYVRDENRLEVSDSIKVTEDNIDNILKTPKVNEEEKVYDFAELFTNEEEKELFNNMSDYITTYNMDMVIVTINENNKSDAEEYARDFYDYNYFGKNKNYDGIILLFDMGTREIFVATTGNAQILYDDYRIERLLDYVYEGIIEEKYYDGASDFINGATDYAKEGIPDSNDGYIIDKDGNYVKAPKKMNLLAASICGLITATIVLIIFISKHKGIKLATNANAYINNENIKFNPRVDKFISTHTSTVRINSGGGSSRGGRSGGSSTSFGSSGRSHGGGGRKF